MNLSILDASALNPGDLSWDVFKKYANITVYPSTPDNKIAERITNCEAVLLNKISITRDLLLKCPDLKYIGVLATGYNVIDLNAAREFNICVTNVPSYSTDAVSQHVFALILNYTNKVATHNASVHDGKWKKSQIFCYWDQPLFELAGKTLGILGYGNIGKKVASIAKVFGMNVIVCPHHKSDKIENCVSINELFEKSDFITLHAPLTEETYHVVNKNTLSLMKKSAYLINTARGGLVNENDLKYYLENELIAGYAADVIETEPMKDDCLLYNAKNCVLTPHLAWAPLETRQRLLDIAFNNFECWIKGKPVNTVSLQT